MDRAAATDHLRPPQALAGCPGALTRPLLPPLRRNRPRRAGADGFVIDIPPRPRRSPASIPAIPALRAIADHTFRIEGELPLRLGNLPVPLPLSVGRVLAAGCGHRATALRSDVAVGSHARVAADLAAGPQVSGSG